MTLDEAIKRAKEKAEEQRQKAKEYHQAQVNKCKTIPFAEIDYTNENGCIKCAEEYQQLAEWLKELKDYKDKEVKEFEKIRTEIEQIVDEEQKHDKKWAIGLRYSLKIIDKYLPTKRKGEKMCVIDNPHFDNGTPINPPINPLLKKYPPCGMGPDYKCMYCDKCPIGSNYKVKPEDQEEYDIWQKELKNYYEANGGLNNVICDIYFDKIKDIKD